VLLVVDRVEGRFVIVGDVHPDQEQPVSAHATLPTREADDALA